MATVRVKLSGFGAELGVQLCDFLLGSGLGLGSGLLH